MPNSVTVRWLAEYAYVAAGLAFSWRGLSRLPPLLAGSAPPADAVERDLRAKVRQSSDMVPAGFVVGLLALSAVLAVLTWPLGVVRYVRRRPGA